MTESNPLAARLGIRQVVDSVLFDPDGADGEYSIEVTLKEETAALAGDRPKFAGKLSCGGPQLVGT